MLLKATAVRDEAGADRSGGDDHRGRHRSRRAPRCGSEFLARVGELLASSLDYQQTLRNVAGLAVPQIADWCAVDLFDADGAREPVAIAHTDPAKLETAARLRAYEPEQLDPEQGLGLVAAHGRIAAVHGDPRRAARRGGGRRGAPAAAARGRHALGADRAADRRPAHDRRADDGQLGIRAQLRPAATSSSPSRSPRARRSPSRTRACTASARRSRARCRAACCPRRSRRSPAGRSRRCTARPARRARSAATSTTSGRSARTG